MVEIDRGSYVLEFMITPATASGEISDNNKAPLCSSSPVSSNRPGVNPAAALSHTTLHFLRDSEILANDGLALHLQGRFGHLFGNEHGATCSSLSVLGLCGRAVVLNNREAHPTGNDIQ